MSTLDMDIEMDIDMGLTEDLGIPDVEIIPDTTSFVRSIHLQTTCTELIWYTVWSARASTNLEHPKRHLRCQCS